ncbi:hypothetical protein NEUTE2DRAFT_60614 [Neurospora tetrasperma FGSC 2509]|nr:hypothetical protein NEUTE2DRAFT_60614 [Neurospora tetrasperma FGSC 2509]
MSQEQPPPDGVPTHGPAPGPSLLSTASASATTTAPSTIPVSVPSPADILGTPTTFDTTITTNIDRRRATSGEIDNWARTIYNYHRMHMPLPTFSPIPQNPSDLEEDDSEPTRIIFTLCSLDLRVARYAAHLFLTTFLPPSPPPSSTTTSSSSSSSKAQAQAQPDSSPPPPRKAYQYLLFSGHSGLLTRSLTGDHISSTTSSDGDTQPQKAEDKKKFQSEASIFASIALSMGVPPSAILIEEQSTNTGENVRFTHALLEKRGIKVKDFLLVQKPYMERRTWGTFGRQWPSSFWASGAAGAAGVGETVKYSVTSPPLEWEEYPDEESGNGRELVINVMVGDLVRIKEYGEKGWQVKMEIPENVWEAGRRLVEEGGYGGHLPEGFRFT